MALLGPFFVLFVVVLVLLHLIERRTAKYQAAIKMSGPGLFLPLVGNSLTVLFDSPIETFKKCRINAVKYPTGHFYYFFGQLFVFTYTTDAFESVTTLTKTSKGVMYRFLYNFIGIGLLTANGAKWMERRKMITPAFHFNILKQFVVEFCHHADNFVKSVRHDTKVGTNLTERIPSYSLDVICDTSMGADTINMDTTNYLQNFHDIDHKLAVRGNAPFLHFDIVYKLLGFQRAELVVTEKIHAFTNALIQMRRVIFANSPSRQKAIERNQNAMNDEQSEADIKYFQKNRYALLDTLLTAELKGAIDVAGIQEEVDTFVFTGHDTVSNGIIYTLMCIAEHPDVQAKLFAEIQSAFKNADPSVPFTLSQINDLTYLDLVIKESLRLLPPVPVITRTLLEDMQIDEHLLPAGTDIVLFIIDLHHNANYFPEPKKFIPERFLPENVENRHKFAYLPFSAGIRNCVGQKFAMLELKTLVIKLVQSYRLESITKIEDLEFVMEMILHTSHPVKLRFVPRD